MQNLSGDVVSIKKQLLRAEEEMGTTASSLGSSVSEANKSPGLSGEPDTLVRLLQEAKWVPALDLARATRYKFQNYDNFQKNHINFFSLSTVFLKVQICHFFKLPMRHLPFLEILLKCVPYYNFLNEIFSEIINKNKNNEPRQ